MSTCIFLQSWGYFCTLSRRERGLSSYIYLSYLVQLRFSSRNMQLKWWLQLNTSCTFLEEMINLKYRIFFCWVTWDFLLHLYWINMQLNMGRTFLWETCNAWRVAHLFNKRASETYFAQFLFNKHEFAIDLHGVFSFSHFFFSHMFNSLFLTFFLWIIDWRW
jgi:hypothetical protein